MVFLITIGIEFHTTAIVNSIYCLFHTLSIGMYAKSIPYIDFALLQRTMNVFAHPTGKYHQFSQRIFPKFILKSVTKHFGQNSKRAYIYNIIDRPHPPFNVLYGNTCAKCSLPGTQHCLGWGSRGGRDSGFMLNSIWKCGDMYILYHCPKTFCH